MSRMSPIKAQIDKEFKQNLKNLAEETVTFSSGAKSSGTFTRFDLIPRVFLERIAKRFEIGAKKYPPFNYRIGFKEKAYVIDRINHLQNHLNAFLNPRNKEELEDDNLAGIGWAVAFLMEAQTTEEGKKIINEIINERSNFANNFSSELSK